ncbi:GNAT family N-acetyltransferase [Microbacterium sp. NPDC076911]|uniref:GNAT family N-acetyltransferase n=1 Tax=Microbacterium sp. NPDC076911 TaxID=3154958 RepID=UPI003423CD86
MTIQESAVDTPEARSLLEEYFHSRELGFANQNVVYSIAFPTAEAFTPPTGVFLVARDETGKAVGCGGIRRISSGGNGIRYELKHLYLRPETRGRGWGRALVSALESQAQAFGASELVLDTHHSLTAAGALYASAGYMPTEPYNDNPNATRWYRKSIAG